jgi:hypothetical protein
MSKSSISIAFAGLISFLVPFGVSAHSTISDSRALGPYQVVLSYFGDAVFAKESMDFEIHLGKSASIQAVEFTGGTMTIETQGGIEVASIDFAQPEVAGFTTVPYEFSKSGNYVMKLSFVVNGTRTGDFEFPLYVYKSPDEPATPVAAEAGTTTEKEVESSTDSIRAILVSLGVLLIAGGGIYLATKK